MLRPQVFFLCSIILTLSLARLQPATAQITAPWEVNALKAIKGRLIDPMEYLNSWNSEDPCMRNWTRVICHNTTASDGYLHVQELQLLQLNLSGTLAPEIGQLSKMKIMDFMWNSISGGIPKEVGNITSLELLLVNGNHLSGSLPEEIGFLPNLNRIQIDQNQISGPIPKSFAYLNKIKYFHMNNNSLSGQIPPELSRLPSLVHLLLDNNNLSGYLPPELSNLPKLLIIQLDSNNFSGSSIPPSYGNITTLLKLSLRNCSLEGPVPDVSGIPQLGYLDLSWNQLRGPIPYSQFARNLTTIDLSHNHLNGTIPGSFTGLPNLQRLSLDNNNLSGSVPSNIWQNIDFRGNRSLILDFQNNSLSNLSNLLSLPSNVTIMLSGNPVCSIQNQQNISQYCQTTSVVVRGGSANNSTLCEPCPMDLPYEISQMSPIPCLCYIPLFVDYRLKSPEFWDFVPYEVQFQQYLSSGLSLSWYQLEISTFMWEEGPRLRMYLKLFPYNTSLFTTSEVLWLEGLFRGWLIPDSDIFGPYELINFDTGGYNGFYEVINFNTGPYNGYDEIMQPKADCPISCGNLSVPFPFGTEAGCFAKQELFLKCETWRDPPSLVAPDDSVVTEISIDEGTLRVKKAEGIILLGGMDSTVYVSGEWNGEVEWAIENMTCNDAMASKTKGYRCVSNFSDCVDVTKTIGYRSNSKKTIGYRCKCSGGFEGNPYIKDGCTDIDECQQQICHGVCHNTIGNYTCISCPHGTDFNYSTRKCKPSNVIFGVIVGLCSGGSLLFLAVIFAVLIRRWKRNFQKKLRKRYFRKNKGILLEQLISCDQDASDGGTKIFSLDELAKATNNFDQARVVGRGGFGMVYKGILTDQRVVAIKRSKLEASTEIEHFINEVAILSQINHRNVVKLHGCCLEAEVPLLVYEFISNGTLYDLLHCEQSSGGGALFPLPWEERLRIAAEVAGALTYLHSAASMSILHRDVKCMNVLLNDSYTAKVSDFGASRSIPIDQTHLVTAVQGTFGYLDPEYYHTGQLNEKSDVYSFGVILLELLTRKKPIFENEKGEKQNLSNYFLWAMGERPLEEVVDAQILGDAGEEGIAGMARLAAECLSLTRGERPTMKDVEMRLQMLRARHAGAPGPGARRGNGAMTPLGGGIPVPAGHHGSRQYSLELEFVSSARVPR